MPGRAFAVAVLAFAGAAVSPASFALSEDRVAQPETLTGDKVPIQRITLYRSGVASFQRRGMVSGNSSVQLRFNAEQINDILKSMVVLDFGGQVDGASYASKDPLDRRMASFAINLADNPGLGDLLNRLRGSLGTLVTTDGPVTGTILGVEPRPQPSGTTSPPIMVPFANIVTSSGIRSINLNTIASFQLQDQALQTELNKALAALAEHRADRIKTVDLTFTGEGARDVVVYYVHEMPVWKVSYRLVLPDDQPAKPPSGRPAPPASPGMPQIHGWAIVENTTDEDWTNVALSLVSGQPVSFRMDLQEPLYVYRPQIPVPTVPGVAPKVYQQGVAQDRAMSVPAPMPEAAAPGAAARLQRGRVDGRAAEMDAQKDAGVTALEMSDYAARARAQATESGEVFQYELSSPVTIQRQRSAMLPIITEGISGRRVSIYNRWDGSPHPMRGAELTNSTGLQLLPGPVTVFDGGVYAGDAQIGHVSPGDKRLLAYSLDLDVLPIVKDETSENIQKIRIVNGLLEQTTRHRIQVSYQFTNKDQKRARTILVEHPHRGMELVEPKKPAEETADLYRFELEVAAGKTETLRVVQETTLSQLFELLRYDLGTLVAYSRQGKVSQKVVEAFQEAARRRQLVNEAERKVRELEQERASIDTDQSRIRQNMSAIDRTSQLYGRYMQRLSEQETRLEELVGETARAREEQKRLQDELNAFVANLNVE